jgi:hypothetical protein
MGYRHRFATVPKGVYDAVKDMTPEQLKEWVLKNQPDGWYDEGDGEGWFSHYLILGQSEIFDFGKNCWFAEDLMKRAQPLFNLQETQNAMEPIHLCTKADFEFVIDEMRKHIANYFKEIFETYSPEQMKHHFLEKKEEWDDMTNTLGMTDLTPEKAAAINTMHRPYNMDLSREGLVNSWLYEYEIFELVLLYRQFNWDTTVLMFYGW